MSTKKVGKRDSIGLAPCHRELAAGAFEDARVSKLAAKAAKKAVKELLARAARDLAERASLMKRKTVSAEMVEAVLVGKCEGITRSDLIKGHKDKKRGLSQAGVVRTVKKHTDLNISEDAKKALVGAAEAYLRSLGQRAGMLARAGKRSTLLENDVKSAKQMLSH
jgi:histone H3/H4